MRSLASLLCVVAWLAVSGAAVADTDEAARLLESTKAADAERAARLYEARVAASPDDYAARLGAAGALTQLLAIRTNGNMPLVDGLQDTDANRALWAEVAPRALEHARAALALRPDSVEAAAAVATAYMFQASSMGIIQSILSGAGGEYRTHAQRVIDLDPHYDDALGDLLLGSFYLVAPWPVGDDDAALEHYEKATSLAPESVRNQYSLGVYWARQDDAARARPHFDRALRMPCTPHAERLFCDWIKETTKGVLAGLGSR
jgi:tetratricopeptide (TPR) repeat protein